MTVLGASILLGWSFQRTTWVVVVVKVVRAPDELMELGPEAVVAEDGKGGAGDDIVLVEPPPPLDWKEAFRLTLGEGRSEPASLELVVWLEELRDSTLQEDMSNDLGLDVFILTLLSKVETLKWAEK